MQRLIGLAWVVACTPAPTPVAPQTDLDTPAATDCDELRRTGRARRAAKDHDAAIATFRSGLPACVGFHHEIGLAYAGKRDYDAAAGEYIVELRDGRPPTELFEQLSAIFDRLGNERRTEITRLGRTKDSAVHVPEGSVVYSWTDRFACPTGRAVRRGRAVVDHRGRRLDALLIACADGIEQMVYFEISAR